MAKYLPYDYNQNAMVVVNFEDLIKELEAKRKKLKKLIRHHDQRLVAIVETCGLK